MNGFSMINIAVLTGISRSAGGLFYAVSSLCQGLLEQSVQVWVYGPGHDYSDEDETVWGAVPVSPYHAVGPMGLSFALRRTLRNTNPQIVHQHGIWLDDQWAALQWQKRTNKPVVISPHGMLDPWAVQNSAWKKKLVGALFANESLQRATCLHALCQSEAASIRAFGLKNPIAIIPNGVELPKLEALDPKPHTPNRKKQLLFLGRIHPKKGLMELITAWSKVKSQKSEAIDDWQLLIAGWDDGGYENGLKEQAAELGLSWSEETPSKKLTSDLPSTSRPRRTSRPPTSDLCFLGPKFGEEKEALLRDVDAFILPSFSEGLPMSVLEAWSYGIPVIMTDFCNLPEGFAAGAAIRIEPNRDAVFQGLEKLASLTDDALRTMGSRGRVMVEEQFTWPKIAEMMHTVYQWCLHGGEPPACMEFSND